MWRRSMFGDTPLVRIESEQQLRWMVEALQRSRVIGVDTEADSMHHYQEKVCLIQISDLTTDYIIDPLLINDMSALGEIFDDPNIVKIFHDCYFDVVSLRRDYGFSFQNLFDTMLGAQFAGMDRFGLADVIGQLFGHTVDKQYQRHDWAARPLLPEHLDYARGDTHFLAAIREFLLGRLVPMNRVHMLAEECQHLTSKQWNGKARDPAAFMNAKGAKTLDDQGKRVLRALWEWRDDEARRLDRPVFKTAPDEVLIALAERLPETEQEVAQLLRPGSSLVRRWAGDFVDAVQAGLNDTRELPNAEKRVRVERNGDEIGVRDQERVMVALKEWRSQAQHRRRLPSICMVSNGQFQAIARRPPDTLEGLRALGELREWQISEHGEAILGVLATVSVRRDGGGEGEEAEAAPKRRRRR